MTSSCFCCCCCCLCVCVRARASQFQSFDHFNDLHENGLLSYATEGNITSTKLITKGDWVQNHSISAASFNSSNTFHAVPPNWSKIVLMLVFTAYSSHICNIVLSSMMLAQINSKQWLTKHLLIFLCDPNCRKIWRLTFSGKLCLRGQTVEEVFLDCLTLKWKTMIQTGNVV
jgi:hypothetical protein